MLLTDRLHGFVGKLISWLLIITTQGMAAHIAYAQDEFSKAVQEANKLTNSLLSQRAIPSIDSSGNLSSGGDVIFSSKQLTGQTEDDYIPANTNTYGSDSATLIQGKAAQDRYETMSYSDAKTSGERAYHIINKSFSKQKPDLRNDPMWGNTDNVFKNIEDIAKNFSECRVSKELVNTGKQLHVPIYKTCDRLPAVEETIYIGHEYDVGVIKHKSGPMNLQSCGDGCVRVWIGTVGNNYWSGSCSIYEEEMSLEIIQPSKISYAKLDRSKFDDYHQVYIGGTKVYNGPNSNFPPETEGNCELDTSWDISPNINVTEYFQNVPRGGELKFKTRTSVTSKGEGYSELLIHFDQNSLIYNDVWTDDEKIKTAYKIKGQIDDGFCKGHVKCTKAPKLDVNGCAEINGFNVCESDFKNNPLKELGISPFCETVEVVSSCDFNKGELCWTDMNGNKKCFNNDASNKNTCGKYEKDPACSYVKTQCVEGAEGNGGECYVQEDTFDCGFTVNNGTTAEEDVVICDGKLQCVGENCYSPQRDLANGDFGEVNAYLEMLKWAKNDMDCEGVPDAPYDPESPPDQYIPVPSCKDGYTYNKDSKQCLKIIACDYGNDDFYAASQRNGIQVVKNSSVLVENKSVPICVPVKHGGYTYTCGEAMKKLATDTFYEVCANEESRVIPNGCPDGSHKYKEETGFCEIPPNIECPVPYELIEGNDIWSKEDDICRIETPVTYNCDISHERYNPKTGLCEGYIYESSFCNPPLGLDKKNDICTITNTEDVICDSGYKFDKGTEYCTKHLYQNANCPSGATLSNDRCNKLLVDNAKCPSGQKLANGVCSVTIQEPPKCESGYSFNASKDRCEKTLTEPAAEGCPNGYTESGDQCKKLLTSSPKCESGYSFNASKDRCEKTLIKPVVDGCPDGYDKQGNRCVKEEQVNAVESCPTEYKWNEREKTCVLNACKYSQSSPKYVWAVLYNNSKCYWNNRSSNCGGFTKGSHVEGKGAASFFEICYRDTANKNVSCPTGFTYKQGYCSKVTNKPVSHGCESGYTQSGNQCKKLLTSSPKCESGYNFNASKDRCEKTLTKPSSNSCPNGYTQSGDQCKKLITSTPMCQRGYGYNFTTNKCEKTTTSTPMCKNGYSFNLSTKKCEKAVDYDPLCGNGYSYDPVSNQCKKTIESTPECQTGYEYYDKQCHQTLTEPPICPDGYAYNSYSDKCDKFTHSSPRLSCDKKGTSYHPPSNTCRMETDPELKCPSLYPIWNEAEKRCMTDKHPIPSIPSGRAARSFSMVESFNKVAQKTPELKEEKNQVTQRSMLTYIDNKVSDLLVKSVQDKELYESGQKQLIAMAAASPMARAASAPPMTMAAASPMARVASAPPMAMAAASPKHNNQNVTCEIFKGESSECKIAVGGIQNCCESPTAPSLGDYIALTTTIMKMDGMTAQLGLIEGYNGAWSYVEAGGDAAWDAVSSLWSSAADTATQDVASVGMMEGFQQTLLTYTNDFLVNTFGQEVAAMFLQEVGKDAAGNAILGASPQLAAVGNALMYCYYAYLAYVVFNLLVGIIYECEEEELDLAMKVELLSTHYIGSYCKDAVLGLCIEKRKVYCKFDSPLSRIIMEEVYKQPQMNLHWGSTRNPHCQGLPLDKINKIDWKKVNLDEWTAILLKTGNMPTQQDINLDALTGVGSMLNVDDKNPRNNALEEAKKRFEKVDVDKTKREAYEKGWNKNQ